MNKIIKQILGLPSNYKHGIFAKMGIEMLVLAMLFATNLGVSPKQAHAALSDIGLPSITAWITQVPGGSGPPGAFFEINNNYAMTATDYQVEFCVGNSTGITINSNAQPSNYGDRFACEISPWASQMDASTWPVGTNTVITPDSGSSSPIDTGAPGTIGAWNHQWEMRFGGYPQNIMLNDNTGSWSFWNWPVDRDNIQSLAARIVNTRQLPAGEYLSNLQIGFQMADDNSGTIVGTVNNADNDYCNQPITPLAPTLGTYDGAGEYIGPVFAYDHQRSCASNTIVPTPDDYRAYMNTSFYNRNTATSSSNMPSQVNISATNTSATITVKNNGNKPLLPGGSTFVANSGATGTCTLPNDAPGGSTCTTAVGTLTASNLILTHTGAFNTPATIPYSIYNVTQTTVYLAGHRVTNLVPNPGYGQSGQPQYIDESYDVPSSTSVNYNVSAEIDPGTSGTFNIPTFTAPSTGGTYNETWTLTDGLSANYPFVGGSISKSMFVKSTAGTISVTADRSTSWNIQGSTTSLSGSGTSQTYNNVPLGTYGISDPSGNAPYGFTTTSTVTGMRDDPWLFAKLFSTANASSGGSCVLTAGKTCNYILTSTYSNVIFQTAEYSNGVLTSLSTPSYTITGPLNTNSYTSAPQNSSLITDSSGSAITISPPPSIVLPNGTGFDYNGADITCNDSDPTRGYTVSFPYSTLNPNVTCYAGDTLTVTAKYTMRAGIGVK